MKPLTLNEIQVILSRISFLRGSPLQEIKTSENGLALGFWSQSERHWLWLDVRAPHPALLVFEDSLPSFQKWKTLPMGLFAKAHFVGQRLTAMNSEGLLGRVVDLEFGDSTLRFILIPHRVNILVKTPDHSMSWNKPRELEPTHPASADAVGADGRSYDEIVAAWRASYVRAEVPNPGPLEGERHMELTQLLAKKKLALERMMADHAKKFRPWQEAGEWIKDHGTLQVPEEFRELVDEDLSFSENIQQIFAEAKKQKAKMEQVNLRKSQLVQEIEELSRQLSEGPRHQTAGHEKPTGGAPPIPSEFGRESSTAQKPPKAESSYLSSSKAKGRTQKLSEGLVLYVGANGGENLKILRKAQAWDYWIHLKDHPGCHGILRRTRNQKVTDEQLGLAGRWVAHFSSTSRRSLVEGDRFEILVVECRFVTPIKGDRLGRVNYRNERVLRLSYSDPRGVNTIP